ncbi:MAG: SusC/RagA family TonB-linked outer membrane protein [Cyclobacteriaceae bacterium]
MRKVWNKCLLGIALLISFTQFSHAQGDLSITGQVKDENGEGLLGVTVRIEGTSTGAITDFDGNFSINGNVGQVILFTMVSMQQQSVKILDASPINIVMKEEAEVLDEIVVNGFQEMDRKLFTGASESLKMSDIKAAGMVDVSRVLEGQVAGVSVDNISGTFGTSPRIRIRGNATINGSNQPLFVVDGVILEDLANIDADDLISGDANTLISSSIANINPDDIETFQILKDASATAIYGARAANGVIVITTKRGKSGALRVNYSGNYSVKLRPTYNQFNLLNSAQEMSVYREMYQKGLIDITTAVGGSTYGALGKMFTLIHQKDLSWGVGGGLNEQFLNRYENANTDWFDVLFREAGLQQQHSLSFTSGNEKSNNYYSISYLNDQGQTISDKVQRFTGTARNTYFLSDKFTFGLKLSASYRDQKVPGTRNREFDPLTGQISRGFDINPFSYALNTSRSITPYDENGDLEFFRRNYAPFNILDELDKNFIKINVVDISAQTDFEVRPRKNLVVKGVFQGRYATTTRDHTVHENSNQAEAYRADQTSQIRSGNNLLFNDPENPGLRPIVLLPQGGFKYLDESQFLNFFSRISAEWNTSINDIHEINVLAGQELRLTNRSSSSSTGMGVVYESGGVVVTEPKIIEFFNLQNIDYFSLNEERDRFLGLFLNGGYSYKGKYIANFTARYDGSNQLGRSTAARYLPTYNVSGAWNAHQEPFMERFKFLDELKFRATYGVSGNLAPGASALLNLQADVTVRPSDVEPYIFISDLTNSDLTWEKLNELNVGFDFSVLEQRISGSVNYYTRKAFDLIGVVQTSGVGGQGLKFGNFADMKTSGIEFSLSTVNYQNAKFSWTTNFNFGYTRDKITRLDFGPRIVDAINQNGAAVLGGPRRGLFSTRFSGLSSSGLPTFELDDGEAIDPEDFDFQDRDTETFNNVLVYEGPSEPRGAGGLTNSVRYKNFSFSFLLSYKLDYKVRLNEGIFYSYNDFVALDGNIANRWVVPGDEDITNVPVILDQQTIDTSSNLNVAYSAYNNSTERVANGDYVRLKNIRVSYALPQTITKKLGIGNANFGLEGQNLFLLYSDKALKGQDPEFFSSGGVSLPQPRMVTFTLSVGL